MISAFTYRPGASHIGAHWLRICWIGAWIYKMWQQSWAMRILRLHKFTVLSVKQMPRWLIVSFLCPRYYNSHAYCILCEAGKRSWDRYLDMLYLMHGKPESQRRLYPPSRRGNPPDERKEGDVNDYILWSDSDRYLHCCHDWIVLHSLSRQKIAATTTNSDGWPLLAVSIYTLG